MYRVEGLGDVFGLGLEHKYLYNQGLGFRV